jgi:hypothetical protein
MSFFDIRRVGEKLLRSAAAGAFDSFKLNAFMSSSLLN